MKNIPVTIPCILIALLALFGLVYSCVADEFSIYAENDILEKTDQNYTHGTEFKYQNDAGWGLKLVQTLYSPRNLESDQPVYNDRPYSCWIHLDSFEYVPDGNWTTYYALSLGTVGPAALGEEVQTFVHEHIAKSSTIPMGWKYQIQNEPTLNGAITEYYNLKLMDDWVQYRPSAGANAGNAMDDVDVDNTLFFGYNIPAVFEPMIKLSARQGELAQKTWALYGFAGCGGKFVARNILLDGNTFAPSRDAVTVIHEPFVGDYYFGVGTKIFDLTLAVTHIERTKEFTTQAFSERLDGIQIGCSW